MLSRRRFLRCGTDGLAAAAVVAPWSSLLAGKPRPAPSNRIALGFIGLGSHGVGMNLRSFLSEPDAQVVALCDVDAQRLKGAADQVSRTYGGEAGYQGVVSTADWREVVDRPDVDAVVISTPDHWHVLPAVAAARAGKDVFCEKPLTLTIEEGRILSAVVRRHGRVFQTASENRSKHNFRRAVELVRNGRIGRLQTMYTEVPTGPGRWQSGYTPEPIPAHFDYDMWLGQAPEAPYCAARCHFNFRWILDYSGGYLTDWGAHLNDIAQWANGSDWSGPVTVEGDGIFPTDGLYNTASRFEAVYTYANGVTLICRSGTPSLRFEGTDGWISVPTWDAAVEASSPDITASRIGPEEWRPRPCRAREHREFLDCVRTRQDTYAPAEVGHRTATVCHLGNISMLLGRALRWDPAAERFPDDPQANAMLSRVMRSPWFL